MFHVFNHGDAILEDRQSVTSPRSTGHDPSSCRGKRLFVIPVQVKDYVPRHVSGQEETLSSFAAVHGCFLQEVKGGWERYAGNTPHSTGVSRGSSASSIWFWAVRRSSGPASRPNLLLSRAWAGSHPCRRPDRVVGRLPWHWPQGDDGDVTTLGFAGPYAASRFEAIQIDFFDVQLA